MEFDKYADYYDAGFMGKGSGRFYADLIKEIEVKDGDAVLDVGCGTGTVLSYIGRQKKIRGFGLDVSEKMVAIAKEKNPNYQFVSGDCAYLPYADESMDVVMACMAYHHFPDQERFRNEAMRVLKPGGHLSVVELTTPVTFPMKQLFHIYSHTVLPVYGRLISKDTSAYSYLTKTIEAFPQGERMVEILRKAGFSEASFKRLTFGICTMYFATK